MMPMSITPRKEPILPKLRAESILRMLKRGERADNRKPTDYRSIAVSVYPVERAEGSALVKLGGTQVVVGVKAELGSPYEDRPNEGVLQVHAEFVPLASPTFEPGPPNEDAIELARVVDRSLREPKAVDLSKLVIDPGKLAWVVYNDIYVLDHDGNLIDASMLASMIALALTKLPRVEMVGGFPRVNREVLETPLPINTVVATVTMGIVDDIIIVDPSLEEESVIDAFLTVAVDERGRVVGLQKRGPRGLSTKIIDSSIDLAVKKAGELITLIKSVVNNPSEHRKGLYIG